MRHEEILCMTPDMVSVENWTFAFGGGYGVGAGAGVGGRYGGYFNKHGQQTGRCLMERPSCYSCPLAE